MATLLPIHVIPCGKLNPAMFLMKDNLPLVNLKCKTVSSPWTVINPSSPFTRIESV
jgi:hypothetical protein